MSPALLPIAIKFGSGILKRIAEKKFGKGAEDLIDVATDIIQNKVGAPVEQFNEVPDNIMEQAVRETEIEMADALAEKVKGQEITADLLKAEMLKDDDKSKEPWWTWAWRPAWMWLLGVSWGWQILGISVTNAFVEKSIEPSVESTVLLGLTTIFTGFYMGGHTAKDIFAKIKWKT